MKEALSLLKYNHANIWDAGQKRPEFSLQVAGFIVVLALLSNPPSHAVELKGLVKEKKSCLKIFSKYHGRVCINALEGK